MTTETPVQDTLSPNLLEMFRERAAGYDRDNVFFQEDWDALKATGFLKCMVPTDLGGGGLSLGQYCREIQRVAEHAPATALAVNMHQYWVGLASEMRRLGDNSLEWILRDTANGEVFAAGHSETGNDMPVFLSTARAERVDGGYKIYGHKQFGSLSPVWTRLGVHAMDASNPAAPQIVHAFMPREATGYTIKETWNTMGMRATRSDDTIIDGAFVPDEMIGRVLPAGAADLFVLCLFASALTGIASVYLGVAHRAMELAKASARKRSSMALSRPMAYHPEVQHLAAQMAMRLEAMDAQLDRVTSDWCNNVDHGGAWPLKLVAAKHNIVAGSQDVVDMAMTMSGGGGMFKSSELERLYRDVRCGAFHPANPMLAHEIVGKIALGIDLGEQPRWG